MAPNHVKLTEYNPTVCVGVFGGYFGPFRAISERFYYLEPYNGVHLKPISHLFRYIKGPEWP